MVDKDMNQPEKSTADKLSPTTMRTAIVSASRNSRIPLSDSELNRFEKDATEILSAFRRLDVVSTEGVAPSFLPIPVRNIMRDDLPKDSLSQNSALKNGEAESGFFKGPRAIG